MNHFCNYTELNQRQISQYREAVSLAFPKIIQVSATGLKYWPRLETYFPEFQLFLISSNAQVIGFINTVPFLFNEPLNNLSDNGWDWMLENGITTYENKQDANFLGGLQVIIKKEYQGQGHSKTILKYTKETLRSAGLKNLVIPIRPTKKHQFPNMSMTDYMKFKKEDKLYDPWIRTHLKNGAQNIKVCENSMNIKKEVAFWESIYGKQIKQSGSYIIDGALNPVNINLENNIGEYRESNIWIWYE